MSAPFIEASLLRSYIAAEPYHTHPVPSLGAKIKLRNDGYGKGYFGASRGNGTRSHKGIDILAPIGTPIHASRSGRVTVAANEKGYGMYVELAHPNGQVTRYAHLRSITVRPGQWVPRGRQIGTCGKSGNADHPAIRAHLHYEIRHDGRAQNPSDSLLDPSIKIFP
ncbi:MAG: hypothetical protein MOGMAGMI_00922 [Candidatus Omnitrophica bacterium]|nr:hypothetical protein [Candidatus Omnitrophota bacterium]